MLIYAAILHHICGNYGILLYNTLTKLLITTSAPPQQELELYKNLQHMHVVTYIDHHFDKHCSTLYIFLEYVPGGSIASMLERCVSYLMQCNCHRHSLLSVQVCTSS